MEHQNTPLGATAALPVTSLSEPLLLPAKVADDDEDLEAQLPSYGASFSRTCLNLTNAVSGIGVLSMPYAVSQGGWLSLALFVLVGAVCYYTGTLIERCMRAYPSAIASYPDIGQFAFGSYGRRAIAFFMYVELYLVAISFLVFEGDNLDKLFPGASFELLMGYRMQGKQLFIAIAAAVVLPTTWPTLNYGLTAVLGYMIYGDDVQSQVTLNLPSGKLYSQVAIVMTLINPLAKYVLLAAPITAAIEEKFSLPRRQRASKSGHQHNGVIFPCLCFLKIYKAEGIRRTEVVAITGIMMIGVFVTVTGTYTSLQQIIRTF
ncbi:hypothetical protein PR202_ga10612 [Eleusine coracana subsp. coracana]|uniref:Amino acid transporter transmembrane domain-containing protein n=1 Tax=Eleusine coracana subsp. coracana TaxID=191504 RepID=A0AAV5C780_ELECO|nr:hypothetical protein PR202_ga10612 [Eleusine coracana subsp. coracana]